MLTLCTRILKFVPYNLIMIGDVVEENGESKLSLWIWVSKWKWVRRYICRYMYVYMRLCILCMSGHVRFVGERGIMEERNVMHERSTFSVIVSFPFFHCSIYLQISIHTIVVHVAISTYICISLTLYTYELCIMYI